MASHSIYVLHYIAAMLRNGGRGYLRSSRDQKRRNGENRTVGFIQKMQSTVLMSCVVFISNFSFMVEAIYSRVSQKWA
jgi:hypothetical protein